MAESRDTWVIIEAERVFDGTSEHAIADGTVVVRGNTIVAVGPRGTAATADIPSTATRVTHAGTLLPGLIDVHTHLTMPGDGTPYQQFMQYDDGVLLLQAAYNAWTALRAGITTLADTGARNTVTFSLRQAIAHGLARGPRLVLCGRPVTRTGGHCWFLNGEADGPEDVRRLVRQLVKEGADIIKVMATGGGTVGSQPYRPSLSLTELRALAEEAHEAGKPAIAHCSATEGTRRALEAGIDVIFHAHFYQSDGQLAFDADLADSLARASVYVNPTLWVNRVLVELLHERGDKLTPDERTTLIAREQRYAGQEVNVRRLVEAGVALVAGSDAGWGYTAFDGLIREMELMTTVGLTSAETLLAATRDAARALGVGQAVGTLEPGKQADLLLVRGDPTQDLGALRDVTAVMQAGQWVPHEEKTELPIWQASCER